MFSWFEALLYCWCIWCLIVLTVQTIGIIQLFRSYSSIPKVPVSPTLDEDDVPHVTIIRPTRDLEPGLYQCLASTFRLAYPKNKLTIYLCVSSKSDSAYPTLLQVVKDFPGLDAKVLVESEDPLLNVSEGGRASNLGPNPKIRNISRAYREAKGDIIWVLDCNVWIAPHVAGRMVDKLCGYLPDGRRAKPYKLVHQLPLVVDTVSSIDDHEEGEVSRTSFSFNPSHNLSPIQEGGGRLEEMFMATSHAKFYNAINTVGVAPCVVGKSNMFRKSHLDQVTDGSRNPILSKYERELPTGIDHFSSYICEDHLIGDLLWRSKLPGYKNHGLVLGDLAIQPMAHMSVPAYMARRARWLRVRKWSVPTATLVEPGIESFLCSTYISAVLTSLPWFHRTLGIPQTWQAMGLLWLLTVTIWIAVDWSVFCRLHSGRTVEVDDHTPAFARGTAKAGAERRRFRQWLPAWLGRELLALPVWTWAVLLGTTVKWRGQRFRVGMDMRVVAMDKESAKLNGANGTHLHSSRKSE